MWRDQFDWVHENYDYAVFALTIHPDVSGKPHVLQMHDRFYQYMKGFEGVKFVPMEDIATDFARRFPKSGTARPKF
jgi:hypothetical protein